MVGRTCTTKLGLLVSCSRESSSEKHDPTAAKRQTGPGAQILAAVVCSLLGRVSVLASLSSFSRKSLAVAPLLLPLLRLRVGGHRVDDGLRIDARERAEH